MDISSRTIGEIITIRCQVETCLSNVTVTFYKNKNVIQTKTITNNMLKSFTYTYNLTVGTDSPGEYACRAVTPKGATNLKYFNIIGKCRLPIVLYLYLCICTFHSSSFTSKFHARFYSFQQK